jgi:hypothetical protein
MRVPLPPSREYTAIFSPEGILPKPEEIIETYYVKPIDLGDGLVWFLTLVKSRGLGLTMDMRGIIRALVLGYRKPNPCPECHKEPAACPYCGYGEATA